MPRLTVERLGGGVLVLRSALWATNSVLVPAGDACLVCDPSIFPDEIEAVRSSTRPYDEVYVLVTHSDFDHVCGIPAFAAATVLADATTARAIAAGAARRGLDAAGREWNASWEGALRVDQVVGDELVRCGTCGVRAIPVPGHGDDGAAFVILEQELLLPGDYLSAVCPPIVLGSVRSALASCERLLRSLAEHSISTVVPGHGPALDRRRAQRIGREDADYLRLLQVAAADAVRAGIDAGEATATVRAVPPPRRARPDFEALDLRSSNARVALAEAGHPAFAQAQPARDVHARHRSRRPV
jgi:hydroxyacylglutathione hydrolase